MLKPDESYEDTFPDDVRQSMCEGADEFEMENGLMCCVCGEPSVTDNCFDTDDGVLEQRHCCTKEVCCDTLKPCDARYVHEPHVIKKSHGTDPDYWEKTPAPACYDDAALLSAQFPDEWCNALSNADCERIYRIQYGVNSLYSSAMGLIPSGSIPCYNNYLHQIARTTNLDMHDPLRLRPIVIGIKRVHRMSKLARRCKEEGSTVKGQLAITNSCNEMIALLRAMNHPHLGHAWTYVIGSGGVVPNLTTLLLTMGTYVTLRQLRPEALPEADTVACAVLRTCIQLIGKIDPMCDSEEKSEVMRMRLKKTEALLEIQSQNKKASSVLSDAESGTKEPKKKKQRTEKPAVVLPTCTLKEFTEAMDEFDEHFTSECGIKVSNRQ